MNRLVRLFVSSTFADFQLERTVLHETVFPRVARYCEQRGLTFQSVDLRWGVTDELAADQQTMQVCLAEIRRSRNLSPRPNCLILLGDRYGWRPLPDTIDAETHALLAALACPAEAHAFASTYVPDANAVPAVHRLRRRDEQDGDCVQHELCLRGLIERAAASLTDGRRRAALSGAATHQEVLLAAFDASARAGEVVAWMRAFDNVPPRADDLVLGDYLADGTRDTAAAAEQARLKDSLHAALPASMVSADTVTVAAYRARGLALAPYLRRFARHVLRCLLHQVRTQTGLLQAQAAADIDPEDSAHQRFGATRREGLLGREAQLAAIAAHVNGPARAPLVLTGAGGSGKTSIMAGAAARSRRGVDIVRFVGATPASATLRALVAGVCAQLDRLYRPGQLPVLLGEGEPLAAALEERMRLASASRPLTLLVDALDQFPPDQQASRLGWLPAPLPPHVRVVLSCRAGFDLPPRALLLPVPPLSSATARDLLREWLGEYNRTLAPAQCDAIEQGYASCPLPLWLRLASEQARHWHSDSIVPALPPTVDGMVVLALTSLQRRHAPALLAQSLAYLGASRYGLSEGELAQLLAADVHVREEFERNSHHPWDVAAHGLPPVMWSRLRLDLGPYLIERGIDGALLLGFFHREFGEVVARERVAPQARAIHAALARHFASPMDADLVLQEARGAVPALRRLSEQAWQLAAAGDGAGLQAVLGDFAFVMAKCGPQRLPELLQDYAALAQLCGPSILVDWQVFLRGHAGLLALGDARWPSYKTLLQLAQEQAVAHPIAQASTAWLATGACTWRWARRVLLPSVCQAPRLQTQFPRPAGEESPFATLWELDGGRLASLGTGGPGAKDEIWPDAVLRLWNMSSGLLEHELGGHGGGVRTVLELPGERLVTLGYDCMLRLWSVATGAMLAVFEPARAGLAALARLDAECLLLQYKEPGHIECRRIDGWALVDDTALPAKSWQVEATGGGRVLLAHAEEDGVEGDTAYALWHVHGTQLPPVPLVRKHRRLAAGAGAMLLWRPGSAALLFLDPDLATSRAGLPAPAEQACMVEGGGIALALEGGNIVLFRQMGGPPVLLDTRDTGWTLACAPPGNENGRADDDVVWGACVAGDGAILTWRAGWNSGYRVLRWRDGVLQGQWHGADRVEALVPGPDGQVLAHIPFREDAQGHSTFPLEIWSDVDGSVLATMMQHFNVVEQARWLPGGRVVSSSEDDGTIRTWDAASGRRLALFNMEGFIQNVMVLRDGGLLVLSYNALLRLNLDYRDEVTPPCGGLQIDAGLTLAWDDSDQATLFHSVDRRVVSVIRNSGDIARARRVAGGLLVWDRTLEQWSFWEDGEHCLFATVPGGKAKDAEDETVLLHVDGILAVLLCLWSDAWVLEHYARGSAAPHWSVTIAAPKFFVCEAYLLSSCCVILVGENDVSVYVWNSASMSERHMHHRQKRSFDAQLDSGLLCCFGRTLCLWNSTGALAASRLLPDQPLSVSALPGGRVLVCLKTSVLMLRELDLQLCWEYAAPSPFRCVRAGMAADGRVLLESRYRTRGALDVLGPDGSALQRLEGLPASGDEHTPGALLNGTTVVVFGGDGHWQCWDLASGCCKGRYGGVPAYASVALHAGLLWATGTDPRLFDTKDGALVACAQEERAGIWLSAAPFSDSVQSGLVMLGASGWRDGEQVFWTNADNRSVVALSNAHEGRVLLKGANGFSNHQHSGFWIMLMQGGALS